MRGFTRGHSGTPLQISEVSSLRLLWYDPFFFVPLEPARRTCSGDSDDPGEEHRCVSSSRALEVHGLNLCRKKRKLSIVLMLLSFAPSPSPILLILCIAPSHFQLCGMMLHVRGDSSHRVEDPNVWEVII